MAPRIRCDGGSTYGGGTAEHVKVSAVPPRRTAVLIVFRGGTAVNDGTTAIMAVPLRFMP